MLKSWYPPNKFPPKKFPVIKFPKLITWNRKFPSKNVLRYTIYAKRFIFYWLSAPQHCQKYNKKIIMFITYILIVLTRNFLSYVVNFGNFMVGNFLGGNFLGRILKSLITHSVNDYFYLKALIQFFVQMN